MHDIEQLINDKPEAKKVKVLVPVLNQMIKSDYKGVPVLQIFGIIQSVENNKFELKLSDGEVWCAAEIVTEISAKISTGELKSFDLIKVLQYSGCPGDKKFKLLKICRPKSIQMKVSKLINSPVPLNFGSSRPRKIRGQRAPRLSDLFSDNESERLVELIFHSSIVWWWGI